MALYRLTRPAFIDGVLHERNALLHFDEKEGGSNPAPKSAKLVGEDDLKKMKAESKKKEPAMAELDLDDPLIDPSKVEGRALSELQKGK